MNEFERIIILQFKEMNASLNGIYQTLCYLTRDTSISKDDKDIGIASILEDIKNELKKGKKEK